MPRVIKIAVAACVCLAGCGGQARSTATSSGNVVTHAPPRPARARRAVAGVDPCPPRSSGTLPQTGRLPTASSACFHAITQALWQAIRQGTARGALYAFFPLPAYEQVKAIGDPHADYDTRLLGEYALDIQAAHRLLGQDAGAAHLVGTIVPQGYAHWISPGACDNRLGYYEVPNARVVYRVGQHVSSFGIASMISWRGTWYVVHLGAVTRSGPDGTVDDPSDGPGTPAPSPTC